MAEDEASIPKIKITNPEQINEKGFTVVYEPTITPQFDIVLIHGLQGHPYRTWMSKEQTKGQVASKSSKYLSKFKDKKKEKNEANIRGDQNKSAPYWPSELLPESFPKSRVLVYGYDSHVSHFFSGPAPQDNIFTLGRNFLVALAAQRVHDLQRPLILLTHSLGGLVVKEALRRSRNATTEEEHDLASVLRSVAGLIFFGTPHRGSAYASIGLTACAIASMAGFSVNDENVRNLKGNSGVLETLREEFFRIIDGGSFWVTSFQEGVGPTRSGIVDRKIVDTESSGLDHPRFERKITIAKNHMDMCRFSKGNDPDFQMVTSEISRHCSRWWSVGDLKENEYIKTLYNYEMYQRGSRIEDAYSGTLAWLSLAENGPGFTQWLENGIDIFWIKGKPGSGKSTTMKFLFNNIEAFDLYLQNFSTGKWVAIGLFFTDRAGDLERSWHGMLSAMLYDLLSQVPRLKKPFLDWLSKQIPLTPLFSVGSSQKPKSIWTVELLQRALLFCKSQKDVAFRACFFIDALDEHEGSHREMGEYLKLLARETMRDTENAIKICVASRTYNELKDLFDECPGFHIHHWTEEDIWKYTTDRLSAHKRMEKYMDAQDTRSEAEELINRLLTRAQGVFLWVRLVIDELNRAFTDGVPLPDILKLLEEIPDELNAFFLRMLQSVNHKYRTLAYLIFESVICSHEPIDMKLLALVVKFNMDEIRAPCELSVSLTDFERQIRGYSGGLLEVQQHERHSQKYIVQPIHQTVNEFLKRRSNLEMLAVSLDVTLPPKLTGHYFLLQTFAYMLENAEEYSFDILSTLYIGRQLRISCPAFERTANQASYTLLSRFQAIAESEGLSTTAYSSYQKFIPLVRRRWTVTSEIPPSVNWFNKYHFLCFAAARNMCSFVESALVEIPNAKLNEVLNILLIFAAGAIPSGHEAYQDKDVLDLLLEKRARAIPVCYEDAKGNKYSVDALHAFVANIKIFDSPRPWVSTISKLLESGADVKRCNFSGYSNRSFPILHWMVTVRAKYVPTREVFMTLQIFFEHGAAVAIKAPNGRTLLETLYFDADRRAKASNEIWNLLFENGAKITKNVAEDLYKTGDSHRDSPLLETLYRRMELYDSEARLVAWKHNPSWWGIAGTSKHNVLKVRDWLGSKPERN